MLLEFDNKRTEMCRIFLSSIAKESPSPGTKIDDQLTSETSPDLET